MNTKIFDKVIGKTPLEIVIDHASEQIYFLFEDLTMEMIHHQNCCENVYIEDISGDLKTLIGYPLTIAEKVTQEDGENEDRLWTFYKFSTVKGSVTIRWCGTSDYYSVDVSEEYYREKVFYTEYEEWEEYDEWDMTRTEYFLGDKSTEYIKENTGILTIHEMRGKFWEEFEHVKVDYKRNKKN